MVTLLGQQRRFETFDFCYHLLRVNRHDAKHDVVKGIGVRSCTKKIDITFTFSQELSRMAERIRRFQMLNTQIFDCLNKHIEACRDAAAAIDGQSVPFENVRCFPPPVHATLVAHRQH